MKKTILWGALFTVLCTQTQADTTEQVTQTPTTTTTVTTPATQPAVQGTQPTMPVQAQPITTTTTSTTSPVINCDYKIDANIKTIDQSLVMTWSEKATTQAFDFTPETIDAQMLKLKNCFTEQGWTGFNTALQKSGNIDAIKAQHLTVSSQIDGTAQMDEAKDNLWKITLPIQVVYQNDKEKVTQLLNVKLTVGRKITGDLGITQMVATPRVATAAQPSTPTTTNTTTTTTPAATTPTDTTSAPSTATPTGTPTTPTNNDATPTLNEPASQQGDVKPVDKQ